MLCCDFSFLNINNCFKNIAKDRAALLRIDTARLPLSDNVKLKSSQVLTIVHGSDVSIENLAYLLTKFLF